MVPKGMLVSPETWRVAREDGRFIFVSRTSGRPLEHETDARQVEVMHGMAAYALLVNALEVTNGRLLSHANANPNQQTRLRRLTDRNHAILALTLADPKDVRALLEGMQFDQRRDAA